MPHTLFTAMILSLAFSTSNAQSKKLRLDNNLPLKIDYDFAGWNKDKTKVDTAVVVFRDSDTGKYAKVNLEETDVNTGKFIGIFKINWNTTGEVSPEVFVPPQSLAKKEKLEAVTDMIEKGDLTRKPYFLRKENGQQLLTIYNSKQQAVSAFETFRKAIKGATTVGQAALEAQKRAEVVAETAKLAAVAAAQETERQKMAAQEAKKIEELKAQQEAMNAAEKQKLMDSAMSLAKEALALYKQEKYPAAENKFRKALELDPGNKTFYFQYGVTLFKNNKFNESLVALDMAEGAEVNPYEKYYFKGLNHMKLKEYDSALADFSNVKNLNDNKLAPVASFFMGVIQFTKEDFKPARSSFEYTLDKSEDPKLDEQAENYIEQIANVEQFFEKKNKPFTFNLSAGLQHDSNVLLKSDSSTGGTATDKAGIRGVANSSLEYRMVYNETHEFTGILTYNDLYTTNTSLKAVAELQDADPMVLGASTPYKYKGMAFGNPYQLTVAPGYETIYLNADGESPRELILMSAYVNTDQTFVISQDFFSTLGIDLRSDDSQLSGSSGTDNDATKVTISSDNTMFQDAKKTQAILAGALVELNTAKGDDATYTKFGLNGGYLTPYKWGTSIAGTLSVNSTTYPKHSSDRKDTELGINAGISKPLTEDLIGMLSYTYTNNQSNVDSASYSKFTLTALLNWSVDF